MATLQKRKLILLKLILLFKQESKRLLDIARVVAREKLSRSEKKHSGIIYEHGVYEKGFAPIRS